MAVSLPRLVSAALPDRDAHRAAEDGDANSKPASARVGNGAGSGFQAQLFLAADKQFPKIEMVTIADFGGRAKAPKVPFNDDGIFDKIYAP